MKSTTTLLIILRDSIKIDPDFTTVGFGMCNQVLRLYDQGKLTSSERYRLNEYLHVHNPKTKYFQNIFYWWKPGLRRPRIIWLNKQIKKLSISQVDVRTLSAYDRELGDVL
jgi:hypothetical protein